MASYHTNVGDNITIKNIRNFINSKVNEKITWIEVDINEFYANNNNESYCKDKFSDISKTSDILIIGGGGLLEGGFPNKLNTPNKIPITSSNVKYIKIPYIGIGIGINYFRGVRKMNSEQVENMKFIVENSNMFSFRNDGSCEIASKLIGREMVEIPDPGLIHEYEKNEIKDVRKIGMQLAWNKSNAVKKGRFPRQNDVEKLLKIISAHNMDVIPHTGKDYEFAKIAKYSLDKLEFEKYISYHKFNKLVKTYEDYDAIIAMRGHSQLISIGLNIPSIYFSTQDKVGDFSIKHGFHDFAVDIKDDKWDNKLVSCIEKLKGDISYVDKWHAIRNANMKKFKSQYKYFMNDVCKIIQL